VSTNPSNAEHDEAQIILEALREIQDNPELQIQVEKDPESFLTRLGLSDVARHAVALGITVMLAAPIAAQQTPRPMAWWQ
jgi:hypothetical protein